MENGTPLDKFGVLYRLLHIEFKGFNSSIVTSGLSHFGSSINSFYLKTVWVPLIEVGTWEVMDKTLYPN